MYKKTFFYAQSAAIYKSVWNVAVQLVTLPCRIREVTDLLAELYLMQFC